MEKANSCFGIKPVDHGNSQEQLTPSYPNYY
ncbi:hypothetical protein FORC066_2752 [Yersinia enterocolitica]|nr:hypothetical protein FORC066_2752 [Yersinia enterocolitica]